MRHFARRRRQRFVVIGAGGVGIQRQVELVFPVKFKARFRHRVIADLRARGALWRDRRRGRRFCR